jgi:hypothetical protein
VRAGHSAHAGRSSQAASEVTSDKRSVLAGSCLTSRHTSEYAGDTGLRLLFLSVRVTALFGRASTVLPTVCRTCTTQTTNLFVNVMLFVERWIVLFKIASLSLAATRLSALSPYLKAVAMESELGFVTKQMVVYVVLRVLLGGPQSWHVSLQVAGPCCHGVGCFESVMWSTKPILEAAAQLPGDYHRCLSNGRIRLYQTILPAE